MAVKERKQITGTTAQINAYKGHEGQIVWDKEKKTLVGMSGTAGKNYPLAPKTYVDNEVAKVNTEVQKTTAEVAKKQPKGDYATNAKLTEGLAGKEDKGTCLPLTGGQLLGDLFLQIGKLGYRQVTSDNALSETVLGSDPFIEGTDNIRSSGAFLALRNHACTLEAVKGSFALATREANGDIPIYLEGFRDGGLFWGGKPIIREVSEGRNSEGGNYFVSFSNGLKIQTIYVHSVVSPAIVNYWTPFTQNPAIYVARIGGYSSLDGYGIEWGQSGYTSAKITKAPGLETSDFFLLAIGY